MTDAASPTPPADNPPAAERGHWRPPQRHWLTTIAIVALACILILIVLAAWSLPPFGFGTQSTENAYVRGRTTVIAPQVSGYVAQVLVSDYAQVQAGQTLIQIDDRTYKAKVEQAQGRLDVQRAALANNDQALASAKAKLGAAVAAVSAADAQLLRAKADMARVGDLAKDGSVSIRERDQTFAAQEAAMAQHEQALANERIAREDIRTVEVQRQGLEAQVEAAVADLHVAQIDLEHTTIKAPEAGQLSEIGVRLGQYVAPGVQLCSLVPPERWVIANFKEAQTVDMAPGQAAEVSVDALGGTTLRGKVEMLAPATGSEFAAIKPDNGTGNFVKVPQRIGVRILIDPDQPAAARLRPGMSVEARIDTSGS